MKNMENKNLLNDTKIGFKYNAKDIILKDDAFQDSKSLMFTEWWYFDTTIKNGYAAQMNVRIASAFKKSIFIVYLRLELFKDGVRIFRNKKRYSLKDFYASKERPYVKLGKKEVIKGTIDKKTGNLIFDISADFNDHSIDLRFRGITKGFKGKSGIPKGKKGKTKEGGWAVILPKAEVNGKMKIKNKEIKVSGIGYHDHNWDVKIPIVINYGWLWGKIYLKNITVIWAKVFETKKIASPLCIICKDKNGYRNLKAENIKLTIKDFIEKEGKMIPKNLNLKLKEEEILLNIDIKVTNIDYEKVFGFSNYFRLHTKCKGFVNFENSKEKIDDTFISEFLRFG